MATRSSPPGSPKSLVKKTGARGSRRPRKGIRLDENSVFELLKKTDREWDDVAEDILYIKSQDKLDEIRNRFPTDDDRLRESIRFWLKRFPFASYRNLAYKDVPTEFVEPIQDPTLTSANLHSALASLSDEELRDVLGGKPGDSREQMITNWMMKCPAPTWERLAGECFYEKKEKALEEVKKHFKRKLEPSLTATNLCSLLGDVKDWSTRGLLLELRIPNSKVKEMEQLYPDLSQCQSALIQFWLDRHPAPSWEIVCMVLYGIEEYELLENVQTKYLKGTSETRRQLKMAMKRGKGKTSITKVVLFGNAGSGKTCTKYVVLEEDPPNEYTSTPLAIRPMNVYRVNIIPSQWKKLNRKQRDLVIAKACYVCDADEYWQLLIEDGKVQLQAEATVQSSPHAKKESSTGKSSNGATDHKAVSLDDAQKSKGESTSAVSSLATYDDLLTRMQECSIDESLASTIIEIKRVQISDCGGQPQFHEILPVFLRGTSLYLFVFKLNEELSDYPKVRYFDKGKQICDEYPRSETNEQILEHCLRVVRSQKAKAGTKPPRIMIIGTHKDKEHECKNESREDKDRKLVKLLLPEFKDEVEYFCLRPKKLVFPLNAKNPGDNEKKIAGDIRELVSTKCAAEAVEIPLQWHGLEVLLEDLATSLERDIISKEECLTAAQDLHFEDEAALDAALVYLDQLNLVFYYPDILPGVVFASAQVLLDKVTELVRAVHEVRYGDSSARHKLRDEMWQKFCDYALVSVEFLAQEEFQPHYIPGMFTHHHLSLLFKKLLIFADFSDNEQFVPALLQRLPKGELGKHRSCDSSAAASPLVLTFPKHGGPLLGVFCASIVALLSDENTSPCPWKLKKEEDGITPCCLYRNCVQFTIPCHPGTITMISSFDCIEVHMQMTTRAKAKVKDLPGFCRMICSSIVKALRKATLAFNYNYSEPEFGFGCPCEQDGFHLAVIGASNDLWICSKNNDEFGDLKQNQLVWLDPHQDKQESSTSLESSPKLHQLDLLVCGSKSLKLIQRVATKWEVVATRLYFEVHTIATIRRDYPQQTESACRSMLTKWLDGEGRLPISWRTLITVLYEAEFSSIAQELEELIKPMNAAESIEAASILAINMFLESPIADQDKTLKALQDGTINLSEVYQENQKYYHEDLKTNKQKKGKNLTKEDIQSIIKEVNNKVSIGIKRYNFLQQAMSSGHRVSLKYLKFVFLGAPGAGKTTFMRRLIGEIINIDPDSVQPSTVVADQKDAIIKVYLADDESLASKTIILTSKWCSTGKENGIKDEALLISDLVHKDESSHPNQPRQMSVKYRPAVSDQSRSTKAHTYQQSVESQKVSSASQSQKQPPSMQLRQHDPTDRSLESVEKCNHLATSHLHLETKVEHQKEDSREQSETVVRDSAQRDTESLFEMLKDLHVRGNHDEIAKLSSQSILVNVMDVGGQPPFLEMIPALALGPGLYLICFDLQNKIDQRYTVKYVTKSCRECELQYSYAVIEVLFKCLSSIACFSPAISSDQSMQPNLPPPSQAAVIVGTHKDKLEGDDTVIVNVESQIKGELGKLLTCNRMDEQVYHKYLCRYDGHMMITVDNTCGEDEIQHHRKYLEKIIQDRFHNESKSQIPASWFIFSLYFRETAADILTLEQCQQSAVTLGIENEDVQHVLWFLHHYVGIIMYYRRDEVEGLEEDIVICKPQVLFIRLGELILTAFQTEKCPDDHIRENFWERGQFTLNDIRKCNPSHETDAHNTSVLSAKQLICILQYLSVLVLLRNGVFFMPAVLKTAPEDKLSKHGIIAPIVIRFHCVFVPIGCFTAMIAQLVCESEKNDWDLNDTDLYKNMVTFNMKGSHNVTLISHPKRYEVHVASVHHSHSTKNIEQVACNTLKIVCDALDTVLTRLGKQYVSSKELTKYQLGFFCCKNAHTNIPPNTEAHPMLLKPSEKCISASSIIKCIYDKDAMELQPRHLAWSGESVLNLEDTDKQTTAPSAAPEGLKISHSLPTKAELSWSPLPEEKRNVIITGYKIQVVRPDFSREISVQGADTTFVEVSGLRPFTLYNFNVSAMTKAGTGPAATTLSKTPEGAPSVAPEGLKISHNFPTKAELSWSPLPEEKQNGVMTGYKIQVVGPDSSREISVQGVNTTSFEVSGLRPFTLYNFNVSAMTKAGTGPAATTSSKTPEGVPSVAPKGLKISHSLPTKAELSWSPLLEEKRNGVITGYKIQVVRPDFSREISVQGADTTFVEVSGLRPFALYNFNVSAMTKAGTGPAATTSSKTPEGAPSVAPEGLKISHSFPTKAELSWSPLPEEKRNGVMTGYKIQVVGPDSSREISVQGVNTTSFEVSGLRPFTLYNFNVSAMTKAGTGPAATTSSKTPEGGPSYCVWWKNRLFRIMIITAMILLPILAAICEKPVQESLTEQNPPPCTFEKGQFSDLTIIQDIKNLRKAVQKKIGNWRGLCENLDVDEGTIETLIFSNDQPEIKKSDCLKAYYDKGEAIWEEVIIAVAQSPLKKVGLAKSIASKYLQEPNLTKILKVLQSC